MGINIFPRLQPGLFVISFLAFSGLIVYIWGLGILTGVAVGLIYIMLMIGWDQGQNELDRGEGYKY